MAGLQSLTSAFDENQPAIGTTLKSCSPTLAEALGYTSLDFFFIDRQHGIPISDRLEDIIRAADLNDIPVITRIPKGDLEMITYLLDIGVAGIMLPQIEDVETVVEASEHVRYHDGRSIATTSRAAGFGIQDKSEYIDYVNEEINLIPQIETKPGVEIVEAVAKLDETSTMAIGPGDLSKSLGVSPGDEKVNEEIDKIFDTASDNGTAVGTFVGTEPEIERYKEKATFLVYNSDVGVVMSHYNEFLDQVVK